MTRSIPRDLLLLGLLSVFCSSCSGPPRTPTRVEVESHFAQVVGGLGLHRLGWTLSGAPTLDTPLTLRLTLEPLAAANPLGPAWETLEVSFDATMPHHRHGMNVVPTVRRVGPREFEIEGIELFMEGEWLFAVDVRRGGLTERLQWWVSTT